MNSTTLLKPGRAAAAGEIESGPQATPIAVAYGDGIGPEIMAATLRILAAAGARVDAEPVEMGESVFRRGVTSGIDEKAWQVIARRRVLLKAPLSTPQGGGMKSINVTLRKSLGLYANVRPCVAYAPYVKTRHPGMDVVVVRENEEDLYAGIEHRQTDDVFQCLKLVTRQGCERIVRYAFEYARAHGRHKVTCMTKDNIMKMTDGLFHRVFDEIAAEYPDLVKEHLIVDIGAARLVDEPGRFDVVVLPNLYGDILSDIAAQMAGSIGLAGSANIGVSGALFEAIHGSAPDIAGQGIANPSGLLQASVMMLHHVGQSEAATRVGSAWLATLEAGLHTPDMVGPATKRALGTQDFAEAVIDHLGKSPRTLRPAVAGELAPMNLPRVSLPSRKLDKEMVGVDLFLDWRKGSPAALAAALNRAATGRLRLSLITSRGVKVWPDGNPQTALTDHWRCRFTAADGRAITHREILDLMGSVVEAGLDVIKTETLCTFDDQPGFSLGQGQ